MGAPHIPVMLEEVLEWLEVRGDGVYVDCTAGAGGHSSAIAARLDTGCLFALDRDPEAVRLAGERLREFSRARVVHAAYGELNQILDGLGVDALDGVLIDAGCSSMQLDTAERGFSFQEDGPLDMRMNTADGAPASVFLAEMGEGELAQALVDFGDVPFAKRIARSIHDRAAAGRLERTHDLVSAVKEALPHVQGMPDEVRTVFQAIRIAVNGELAQLEAGVRQALARLAPGGRAVVLTFHSGEDRVVKDVFREASRAQIERWPDGRTKSKEAAIARLLTPKPVLPGEQEMRRNPRSKSAKLRAAQKL